MKTKTIWLNKYVIFVSVMRISGYVYMLYRPLEGILLSMLFDVLDWLILSFGKLPLKEYHNVDKPLDYLQYLFLIPLVFNTYIFDAYILLLAYRTLGQFVVSYFKDRRLYFLFPNFAEYLALAYFLIQRFNWNLELDSIYFIVSLTILKLVQEYWIHVKPFSLSWNFGSYFRDNIYNRVFKAA